MGTVGHCAVSWVFTAACDFDRRYPPLSRAKASRELEGVSRKQFPRLWENTDVKLNFLMRYFKPGDKGGLTKGLKQTGATNSGESNR